MSTYALQHGWALQHVWYKAPYRVVQTKHGSDGEERWLVYRGQKLERGFQTLHAALTYCEGTFQPLELPDLGDSSGAPGS